MEARGKIGLLLIIAFCVIILVAGIFRSTLKADSSEEVLSRTDIKVNIEGKKQSFVLEKTKSNGKTGFDLRNKNVFGVKDRIVLEGFENLVSTCQQSVVNLGNNFGEAICLEGDVGAHSRNLVLVKVKDGKFSSIFFSNSEGINNYIVSDAPNFIFADYNKDGIIDIVVDNRNYDANPLIDAVRNYYRGTGQAFTFDRKENIQYHNN